MFGFDKLNEICVGKNIYSNVDSKSYYFLSLKYEKKNDLENSRYYCQLAADKGDIQAIVDMGDKYLYGKGVPVDYTKSCYYYKKAAKLKSSIGMYNYGVMLQKGRGVLRNLPKAAKYFEMSADLGNVNGMYNIAYMYDNGQGVPVNYKKAAYYYKKAAAQGDTGALWNLGIMESSGKIPKDFNTDDYYLKMSVKKSDEKEMVNYASSLCYDALYTNIDEKKKQEKIKKAAFYSKKAAENGNIEAMILYGNMFMYKLLNDDIDRAIRYSKIAAENKAVDGMIICGILLLLKSSENIYESLKYFQMAADCKDNRGFLFMSLFKKYLSIHRKRTINKNFYEGIGYDLYELNKTDNGQNTIEQKVNDISKLQNDSNTFNKSDLKSFGYDKKCINQCNNNYSSNNYNSNKYIGISNSHNDNDINNNHNDNNNSLYNNNNSHNVANNDHDGNNNINNSFNGINNNYNYTNNNINNCYNNNNYNSKYIRNNNNKINKNDSTCNNYQNIINNCRNIQKNESGNINLKIINPIRNEQNVTQKCQNNAINIIDINNQKAESVKESDNNDIAIKKVKVNICSSFKFETNDFLCVSQSTIPELIRREVDEYFKLFPCFTKKMENICNPNDPNSFYTFYLYSKWNFDYNTIINGFKYIFESNRIAFYQPRFYVDIYFDEKMFPEDELKIFIKHLKNIPGVSKVIQNIFDGKQISTYLIVQDGYQKGIIESVKNLLIPKNLIFNSVLYPLKNNIIINEKMVLQNKTDFDTIIKEIESISIKPVFVDRNKLFLYGDYPMRKLFETFSFICFQNEIMKMIALNHINAFVYEGKENILEYDLDLYYASINEDTYPKRISDYIPKIFESLKGFKDIQRSVLSIESPVERTYIGFDTIKHLKKAYSKFKNRINILLHFLNPKLFLKKNNYKYFYINGNPSYQINLLISFLSNSACDIQEYCNEIDYSSKNACEFYRTYFGFKTLDDLKACFCHVLTNRFYFDIHLYKSGKGYINVTYDSQISYLFYDNL